MFEVDGRKGCQLGRGGRAFGVAEVDTGVGGEWRLIDHWRSHL